jgi:hypothetical protein
MEEYVYCTFYDYGHPRRGFGYLEIVDEYDNNISGKFQVPKSLVDEFKATKEKMIELNFEMKRWDEDEKYREGQLGLYELKDKLELLGL